MSDVLARAAEVLGAHQTTLVTCAGRVAGYECTCGYASDHGWTAEGAATQARRHQVAYLADAGLLAECAPVAGGNGAVSGEPGHPRPTTHATPDGAIDARLVAQRAATDAWKARAEELGERLDEAHAKIERMEEL